MKVLKTPARGGGGAAMDGAYEFGPFRLDCATRELRRGDQLVALTPKAFDLLRVLVTSDGRAIQKGELMKLIWPDSFVGEDSLTQNIATLRKALGDVPDRPHYIVTVPRHGYRFAAVVQAAGDQSGLLVNRETLPAVEQSKNTMDVPGTEVGKRAKKALTDRTSTDRWAPGWTAVVAASAVITIGFAIWVVTSTRATAPVSVRFVVAAPDGTNFSQSASFLAVSPNGRLLAFLAARPGQTTRLWVRSIDSLVARELADTDGALGPFWSPDSQSLGFVAQGQLKTVNLLGEPPKILCDVEGGTPSGTWSPDGIILFARGKVISRIPAAGGTPAPVTSLDSKRGETAHLLPQFLPDGRHFFYVAHGVAGGPINSWIVLGSLDGSEHRPLIQAFSQALYADPGYMMFLRDGTLFAQPFDPKRLQLSDAPQPVAEADDIDFNSATPRGMFTVSQTGVLAYRTSAATELGWFDRAGNPLGWTGIVGRGLHPALSPALSPDGQRLALSRFDAKTTTSTIWILDLRYGSVGSRFTTTYPAWETCPVWSRDGSHIVYASGRAEGGELYDKTVDGTTEERALAHRSGCPLDISPDGRDLLFATPRDLPDSALYRVALDGGGAPALLAGPWPSGPHKRGGKLSPDGHWLAYVSPASGRDEIYVRSFHDAAGGSWQVSSHGGIEPQWRADGRELFFIGADQQLMAVPVTAEHGFRAGTPTALFLTRLEPSGLPIAGRNQYVVAPDGQRFLLDQPRADPGGSPVTLLVNWRAALKR